MVYLEFFHGRNNPDEDMDGWGFDGPVIGPFPFVHITYGYDIKLGLIDSSPYQDPFINEMLAGAYYGDISTFSKPDRLLESVLLNRIMETKKVFQTDPVCLIGDTREWVKVYTEWRLKHDPCAGKHAPAGRSIRQRKSRSRRTNP